MKVDIDLLRHALTGYELHRAELLKEIAEIQAQIAAHPEYKGPKLPKIRKNAKKVKDPLPKLYDTADPRSHPMTPEGRAKVSAAQKKRWAKIHAEKGMPKVKRMPKPAAVA